MRRIACRKRSSADVWNWPQRDLHRDLSTWRTISRSRRTKARMHTTLPNFDTFKPETPNVDSVVSEYATVNAAFEAAKDAGGRVAAIKRWDALRIKLGTWQSVVHARFTQDTRNDDYKAAKDRESELSPKFLGPETEFKKMLLKSPYRTELEAEFGTQAFRMWENDVITFDPKIEADLVAESKLASKYTSLKSGAQILFRGERSEEHTSELQSQSNLV